ncbi:hypothetical protein ABH994_000286 [Bradyrhizobium yuanmingense]
MTPLRSTAALATAAAQLALTIADGSGPSQLASKFLKSCWVLLLGVATWEKT